MDRILGFLEDHFEKVVLTVVGAVCLWLLATQVVLDPNAVEFDGRRLNPGEVDGYILERARQLEAKLNHPPAAPNGYDPKLDEYKSLVACSIKGVDFGISPPVPETNPEGGTIVRKYSLPEVGDVKEIAVGHIRAVAYEPIGEVSPESPYESSRSAPNDLDLVTVQGSFDVAGLYRRFYECFAGPEVKPEWRDPCLAEPVFAAVHLQRQELGADGRWGAWVDVPRARVDQYRELFDIVEDVSRLPPGGMKVRMLRYRDRYVQMELLQPLAYQIASADEEWFPPKLYGEFKAVQKAVAMEEKRRAKEEQEERERTAESTRRRRGGLGGSMYEGGGLYTGSGYSGREPGGRTSERAGRRTSRTGVPYGSSGYRQTRRYGSRSRSSRTRGRDQSEAFDYGIYGDIMGVGREEPAKPTVDDVYRKLEAISINELTDLKKLDELVFWALDDSVQPGKKYRYRIRLGVFNPVAGTNQLKEGYHEWKNKVILWSNFSPESEVVEIPRRLYFFAKGIQEAAKEVTVEVAKYVMGYWYSEDFKVKSGEVIGDERQVKEAERAKKEEKLTSRLPIDSLYGLEYQQTEQVTRPELVNYDTGAVVVDVVAVDDWSSERSLRSRRYFDMLYSYDGMAIEHMPIGSRYWPEELRAAAEMISSARREPLKPLRPWGDRGLRSRRGGTGGRYTTPPPGLYRGEDIGEDDYGLYRRRGGL